MLISELVDELLLSIFAATEGQGAGLVFACKRFNQLFRPALARAWRSCHTVPDANRSLKILHPGRFAALQAVSLRAVGATVTADLERLQLPQLASLELENILFESWGFNDICHLTGLTRLSVDSYSGGRAAALNEDGSLGALQALPRLSSLCLRNLASDCGLQHLAGVTALTIELMNRAFVGAGDDTDEEAAPRMDTSLVMMGACVAVMPNLRHLTLVEHRTVTCPPLNSFILFMVEIGRPGTGRLLERVAVAGQEASRWIGDLEGGHLAGLFHCQPNLQLIRATYPQADPPLHLPPPTEVPTQTYPHGCLALYHESKHGGGRCFGPVRQEEAAFAVVRHQPETGLQL